MTLYNEAKHFKREITFLLIDSNWHLTIQMQKLGKLDTDTNSCIHPDTWLEHFNALLNEGEAAPTKLIDELEALEKQPSFSELDFRIKHMKLKKLLVD